MTAPLLKRDDNTYYIDLLLSTWHVVNNQFLLESGALNWESLPFFKFEPYRNKETSK